MIVDPADSSYMPSLVVVSGELNLGFFWFVFDMFQHGYFVALLVCVF